ncbi:unnamed protein product, partial [Closterium sp. NIES-64]
LLFMVLVVGWVSYGEVIAHHSSYPSSPCTLSPIPPLPLREPMFMVLGVVWVSCGGGIAKHSSHPSSHSPLSPIPPLPLREPLFMVLGVVWVSCSGGNRGSRICQPHAAPFLSAAPPSPLYPVPLPPRPEPL